MLVALVTWCVDAQAETVVDSPDVGGQVWTAEGSPYVIRTGASLTVAAGSQLRIEAGSEVVFPANAGALNVVGTLTIAGSLAAPVVLHAAPGVTGSAWQGIIVESNGSLVISGAVIQNALAGIQMRSRMAQAIVMTTFEDCSTGLMVLEGTYTFDSIVMRHNGTGVSIEGATDLTLTNALLQDNDRGVLVMEGAEAIVVNATVDSNRVAFLSPASSPGRQIVIQSSIISNSTTAIEIDEGTVGQAAGLAVSATTFWANTSTLVHKPNGILPPTIVPGTMPFPAYDNTVADPMYVTATDLHLRPGSPCVDSGLPTGAPDHDLDQGGRPSGGSVDRGAFELSATSVTGAGGANGTGGSGGAGISIGGGGETAGGDAGCACGVSRHAGARDGVVFGGLLLLPLARRLRRAALRARPRV